MQRVFNFSDAYAYFKNQLGQGLLTGNSYVFYGDEGTGKSFLLDILEEIVRKEKKKIFRARSFSSNEALMYQVYNELLNQFYGEFKERQLPQIVEAFSAMKPEDVNNNMFVVEGLENMVQSSRELFIYIARLASRKGFTLIGTVTKGYEEDEKSIMRFIDLIDSEPDIRLINFHKNNLEDVKLLLKLEDYNLPNSFIQELFRLTNGNLKTLRYTLKYYRNQGIINERNSLEEVTYRYFPIPPTAEIRFEQIIKGLNECEKAVLEVISLIQEDLSPGFIADLTQKERDKVIDALEKLTNQGLVSRVNLNYSILNSTLSDIVLKLVYSSPSYIISDDFVKQPLFKTLPFITRLRVHELRKDGTRIEELVNAEWRPFLDRISYIAFSRDLFSDLQRIVDGKEAKAHLALMVAQSLQNYGDYEEAMNIYTSDEITEVEPLFAKLSEARLLQKMDKVKESTSTCKKILEMKNLTPYYRVSAMSLLAVNYSFSNMIQDGVKMAEETAKLAVKNNFEGLTADSYGTLGTLMVKKFDLKKALEWYNKSMEIARKNNFFDRELLMLNNIAIIHSYWGQFEKAASMLGEIIEKSYISGELLSRAYATYNLTEIYYNIDKVEEFRSYFPSAIGLVRLVGDSNLAYPFFRFASSASIDLMSHNSAIGYSEELLKIAKSLGNREKMDIARGLYILAQPKLNQALQNELETLFSKEMSEVDDFIPLWYLFAGSYFGLKGMRGEADKAFERQKRAAEVMGDSNGLFVANLGSAFQLLLNGKKKELGELIKNGFSIGEFKNAYPRLHSMFEEFVRGKVKNDPSRMETYFNLAGAILMGIEPLDIERGDLNDFDYFQKCRVEIGKKVEPI